VPYDQLPQLQDPPLGAIATANNDMTGAWADGDPFNDGVPALQSAYKADGTREQRILDMLAAGGNTHSVDTFSAMQGDVFSLYGQFTVAAIQTAIGDPSSLAAGPKAVYDALAAWQYTCPTGLVGDDPTSAKSTWAIMQQALGDEIAASCGTDTTCTAAMESGVNMQLVARALSNPGSITSGPLFWDDVSTVGMIETESDIIVRALTQASDVLATMGAPDDWRWGKVHTLSLSSIYANFGLTKYNYGPYAAPGGLFTVNVGDPNLASLPSPAAIPDFSFTNGPSVRFLVDAAPSGPTMKFQLPGGEDLHRESPFYNNLLPRWLHNQPVDFAFGPGAVKKPAKTVDISPAN
jgi:penicillin amidase